MKIWLINHYAVPPQYYPLARQTYFAKYLQRMGHEVTIFAASTVHNSDINLITDGSLYKEDFVNDIHYVYIRCHDYNGNGIKRIANIQEFADKLPRVCSKFPKPDAIVATSMPPMSCAAGIRLARKYGCKGVAEIADLWPESIVAYGIAGPKNPAVLYLRRLEKWIYTHADAVIFTMEGGRDYIIEHGWDKEHGGPVDMSKVHHINNGVDLEVFDYNKEHYTIDDPDLNDPETFKVVYTGSIRKVNNVGLLLDVAKEINNPKVKILIWGAGDELEQMKQRVKEEKIENVVFKGKVDKKYIPYVTCSADLNLMHGSSSGVLKYGLSANKLFDYFAARKPILCDFESKHNPMIDYHAGRTANLLTSNGIAAAIEAFAEMPATEYEEYCENADKAAKNYDFDNLTNILIGIIKND